MGTERGLPISCFNVHVPDNIEGITHKLGEVIMQTKIGGGTSGYFGELRERGSPVTDNGKSSGAVSFMKLFDTVMDTISQGGVRRGAFAAYLDIDHDDVKEFLEIKMKNRAPEFWSFKENLNSGEKIRLHSSRVLKKFLGGK